MIPSSPQPRLQYSMYTSLSPQTRAHARSQKKCLRQQTGIWLHMLRLVEWSTHTRTPYARIFVQHARTCARKSRVYQLTCARERVRQPRVNIILAACRSSVRALSAHKHTQCLAPRTRFCVDACAVVCSMYFLFIFICKY